jgi:hypothetical protein
MVTGTTAEWLASGLTALLTILVVWGCIAAALAGLAYVVAMGLGAFFSFTVAPFLTFFVIALVVVFLVVGLQQ